MTVRVIVHGYSSLCNVTNVGYSLKTYARTIAYQGSQDIGWFIVSDKSKIAQLVVTAHAG